MNMKLDPRLVKAQISYCILLFQFSTNNLIVWSNLSQFLTNRPELSAIMHDPYKLIIALIALA